MLREYVYVDRNRVEDFLSQLEGGVSDSTLQSESSTGAIIEGGVNIGVVRLGSSISAPTISQEDLRRTTDVALFERLYAHMQRIGIKRIDDRNEIQFGAMHRGELIELECDAIVSGLNKLFRTLGELQTFAAMMEDPIHGLDEMRSFFGDEIAVRYSIGDKTVAYSSLSPDSVRGEVGEIDGDCTVLLRIRKVVKSGRREPLRKLAGMKLSVKQIEEMFASFNLEGAPPELDANAGIEDLIAAGPSLIVTTVAIYR